MPSGAHALVFGASGLAGWAVVDQLLENYPAEGTFSKVTALVNRPLSVAESYWPSPSPSRPKLELVCNVNLAEGRVEEFTALLKEKVEDIGNVTHAFYFAYKQDDDADAEVKINREMAQRAIGALNSLSPNLTFVAFPTGTKGYGVHVRGGVFTPPLKESMGRIPEPAASKLFYYALADVLDEQSNGKNWTWCEVRPDAIIGFAPNGSVFNIAAHWASYLSLYALVEGKGVKSSADIIARFSIWAALNPDKTGDGQLFNVADTARPSSKIERWPAIAAYFGLEGVGPVENDPNVLKPGAYIKKHQHVLEEAQHGNKSTLVFKPDFLDAYGYRLNFDRQMSLDKARSAGFTEEVDPISSWFKTFDRFKKASMVPGWKL